MLRDEMWFVVEKIKVGGVAGSGECVRGHNGIIWTVSDIGRDCGGRDALTSEIPFSCVSFLSLESYHVLQYIVLCTHGRRGGGRRAAEEVVGLELSSRPAKSGHGGSSAADLRRVRSYHVSFEVWTGPMAHGIITLSRSLLETFLRRPLLGPPRASKRVGEGGSNLGVFLIEHQNNNSKHQNPKRTN